MKTFRLNRLFNAESKRCLDVAVDHGFFNELSFLSGIEDLAQAVHTLVKANPDAIQLTIGQAELLQRIRERPSLLWCFEPTWPMFTVGITAHALQPDD